MAATAVLLGLLPWKDFGENENSWNRADETFPAFATHKNPKLTTVLDDLAQAVSQRRGGFPLLLPNLAQPNLSGSATPKSVRDALRGRTMRVNDKGDVQVYILMNELSAGNLAELRSAGVSIELEDKPLRTIQASIPVARLEEVSEFPFVDFVRLPDYAFPQTGSVDTEGDSILLANQVRSTLHVDGTGVRVGAISDGLKGVFATGCTTCSGVANGPISTGDLPDATGTRNSNGVLISSSGGITAKSFKTNGDLEGLPTGACSFAGAGAEGTALLEIIHDIAPGAQLFFANADTDLAFISAVNYLAQNTDVAVDDLGFFGLPSDGTSDVSTNTANALNSSTNPLRAYFTSVANAAQYHYLGNYTDSGVDGTSVTGEAGDFHLFQPSAGTTDVLGLGATTSDRISLLNGGEAFIVLTWNDPYNASTNNYDLFLTQESTGTVVGHSTNPQTGSQPPLEYIDYINNTGAQNNFNIYIENVSNRAAAKQLNLYVFQPECAASGPQLLAPPNHARHNYNTVSSSVPAESDAGGSPVSVISVGAICSGSASAMAANPSSCNDPNHDQIEFYSSNGPTLDGRLKPDVTAIDGVSITGAGSFENPFFGTSAAAPHGVGVAALLLQAAPCLLSGNSGARSDVDARTILRNLVLNNAVNLDPAGQPDNVFGYGRIDALAAADKTIPTAGIAMGQTVNGTQVTLNGTSSSDPDACPLTYSWTGTCGAATGAGPVVTCPGGANNVTLTVTNNGVTVPPSATAQFTVTDFTLGVSPGSASVTPGQSASYTATITPGFGPFTNQIAFGCTNLPAGASCAFTPATLTPGANPASATVAVTTMAPSAARVFPEWLSPGAQAGLEAGAAVVLWLLAILAGIGGRRRKFVAGLAVLCALLAGLAACGGGPKPNPGTPPGTYSIIITATSASLTQTTGVMLVVQ